MGRVAAAIEAAMTGKPVASQAPTEIPRELVEQAPAIIQLCQTFELGAFERDVILACAGGELDVDFARRTGFVRPSLGLALAAFSDGNVGMLSASAPLRQHRIFEPLDGSPLIAAPLVLDDRLAQFLAGSDACRPRLVRGRLRIGCGLHVVSRLGRASTMSRVASNRRRDGMTSSFPLTRSRHSRRLPRTSDITRRSTRSGASVRRRIAGSVLVRCSRARAERARR